MFTKRGDVDEWFDSRAVWLFFSQIQRVHSRFAIVLMARKHLLANVTASLNAEQSHSPSEARSEYTRKGASRSMMQSLDELAENSFKILSGETVISVDTADLDGSFVSDRIDQSDEEYVQLREAIRQSGQSSPILVRPHPNTSGRYMIVFGHRRAKVARELGIPVRAVVKPLADIEHVIAQGQENTARSDLSFIEKALFAQKLLDSGMTKATIKAALTVDDTLLSRMLSVVELVPEPVLRAVGAAKGVGRDRWEELKRLVQVPSNAGRSAEFVGTDEFKAQSNDQGFNLLLSFLKSAKKPKKAEASSTSRDWAPTDRSLIVAVKPTLGGLSLEFTDNGAKPFGEWLTRNLDSLYEAFRKSEEQKTEI